MLGLNTPIVNYEIKNFKNVLALKKMCLYSETCVFISKTICSYLYF